MNQCVIIVGGFSTTKYYQKMIDRVTDSGFELYTDTKNGLNRVGVMSACSSSKLNETLEQCKTLFDQNAWVLPIRQ